MTEIAIAYFDFWNRAIPFGGGFLPFWPEQTVPSGTPQPYGTYSLSRGDFFASNIDTVRIWTRSPNVQQLVGFLDSVAEAIPHEGVILDLPDNKGALALYRGSPWQQIQPTDEQDLRVGYCNVLVHSYML